MSLNVNDGFSVGSAVSIDSRIVVEKISDLKEVNHNVYPSVYFALCEEDKNLYLYDKDANPDPIYGRFRPFTSEGGIIEVESESDLPNPPELNVYVTKHKEIVTTDMSSLWSYNSTYQKYAITFRLNRNDHFIMNLSNSAIIDLNYSSPSDEWIKRPDPYKDTFYYRYSGDSSEIKDAPSPCAIVQSLSTNTATGSSLILYAITVYADQPYSFEIESNYKPTYYYNVYANSSKEINPLCIKAVSGSTEYSLDEDFTITGFEYTAETRTVKNTTSKNMIFETIIGASEHKTEDREMQVWARDVELVTKEYFIEHGGGDTEDYLTYSSNAFDTIATHTYEIDEYTQEEVDAMFSETPEELEELSKIISDNLKSKSKLWSSAKVADEIAQAILESNAYADGLIGDISSIELIYVESLPLSGERNQIFILKGTPSTMNLWDTNKGSWITIGNFEPNMSDYYKKTEIDDKLELKANKDEVLTTDDVVQNLDNPSGTEVLSTFGMQKVIDEIDSKYLKKMYDREFTGDINDLPSGTIISVNGNDNGSKKENCPTYGWMVILTSAHNNSNIYKTQLAISLDDGVYYRNQRGGNWDLWQRFSMTNEHEFQATVVSNASLNNVFPAKENSIGFYNCIDTTNKPSGSSIWGFMRACRYGGTTIQYYDDTAGECHSYRRVISTPSGTVVKDWIQII